MVTKMRQLLSEKKLLDKFDFIFSKNNCQIIRNSGVIGKIKL